jgi:hypothetical protein
MPPRNLTMLLPSTSLKGSKKLIFEFTLTPKVIVVVNPTKME